MLYKAAPFPDVLRKRIGDTMLQVAPQQYTAFIHFRLRRENDNFEKAIG